MIFQGKYTNPYKTGNDMYVLTAESRNYSKDLFKINICSKSIPYELNYSSCWSMFVTLSRDIHGEIENGENEKDKLGRLLNIWSIIFSVANVESRITITDFIYIYEIDAEKLDLEVLRRSPMFLMMYLMFNCENLENCKYLVPLLPTFRKFIDSLVALYNGTAVKQKTIEYAMKTIFKMKLLSLDLEMAKQNLVSNLNGEFSKYLCLLGRVEFIPLYYSLLDCLKK